MKKLITLLWILIINFTSCDMSNYKNNQIPTSEQAVNNLIGKIADSIQRKYNIRPVGTNVAMPGGDVRLLGLDFHISGPLSQKKIREILIDLTQDFLELVNGDKDVRPYLKNYPFTIDNIDIAVFVIAPNGRRVDDPNIGIAEISSGTLAYKILVTTNGMPEFKNITEESYEEALRVIQTQ